MQSGLFYFIYFILFIYLFIFFLGGEWLQKGEGGDKRLPHILCKSPTAPI